METAFSNVQKTSIKYTLYPEVQMPFNEWCKYISEENKKLKLLSEKSNLLRYDRKHN